MRSVRCVAVFILVAFQGTTKQLLRIAQGTFGTTPIGGAGANRRTGDDVVGSVLFGSTGRGVIGTSRQTDEQPQDEHLFPGHVPSVGVRSGGSSHQCITATVGFSRKLLLVTELALARNRQKRQKTYQARFRPKYWKANLPISQDIRIPFSCNFEKRFLVTQEKLGYKGRTFTKSCPCLEG